MSATTTTTTTAPTREATLRRDTVKKGGFAALTAAGLSLGAGLIHLWAAPEHFLEWWGHGAFFVIAAACQGLFAVSVLRWPMSRTVLLSGIAGNLSIVFLYMVSRTWGIPFGSDWTLFSPGVAHLEDADALGMLATASELGIMVASVALLDPRARGLVVNVLLLAGAGAWAMRIFGILP